MRAANQKNAAVAGTPGSAAQNMMIVSGRVAMDALGRAIAQCYPTAQIKGSTDTAIDNSDTGKVETVYDMASNPIQKITAVLKLQNKAIHYDYDHNRLIAVHYPNNPGNDVSYTYGGNTPQAKQYNQAGRVVKITSQAGVEERRYDKLGETVQETKTVSSHTQGNSPNSPEVYTTQYDFDTLATYARAQSVRVHRLTINPRRVNRPLSDFLSSTARICVCPIHALLVVDYSSYGRAANQALEERSTVFLSGSAW